MTYLIYFACYSLVVPISTDLTQCDRLVARPMHSMEHCQRIAATEHEFYCVNLPSIEKRQWEK